VSEETAPERIAVIWSPEARADLRAIDREPARKPSRRVLRRLEQIETLPSPQQTTQPLSGG
jgi:hypothetical protein